MPTSTLNPFKNCEYISSKNLTDQLRYLLLDLGARRKLGCSAKCKYGRKPLPELIGELNRHLKGWTNQPDQIGRFYVRNQDAKMVPLDT